MRPEPPDSGDLDALQDLERSRGYQLTMVAIAQELERRRAALEAASTPQDQTAYLRGYIAALRMVFALPATLEYEISQTLKDVA